MSSQSPILSLRTHENKSKHFTPTFQHPHSKQNLCEVVLGAPYWSRLNQNSIIKEERAPAAQYYTYIDELHTFGGNNKLHRSLSTFDQHGQREAGSSRLISIRSGYACRPRSSLSRANLGFLRCESLARAARLPTA